MPKLRTPEAARAGAVRAETVLTGVIPNRMPVDPVAEVGPDAGTVAKKSAAQIQRHRSGKKVRDQLRLRVVVEMTGTGTRTETGTATAVGQKDATNVETARDVQQETMVRARPGQTIEVATASVRHGAEAATCPWNLSSRNPRM